MKDKLNNVDFRWYIVRTRPHREKATVELLEKYKAENSNILEIYAPDRTTVDVGLGKEIKKGPLFSGFVFVLATQKALSEFLGRYSMEEFIQYERKTENGKKASMSVIPEEQMRQLKDYNENYPDTAIPLERPYTDYAFNPKTNEPNDIVKVIDGPLAGTEGYITKFRRDKRLVYHLKGLDRAVSIPNIWNFHVVRVHNAEGDKQTIGTIKERAVDLLIGLIQGCGYGDKTLPMLYEFIEELTFKPSLVDFCKSLYNKGHKELSQRVAKLNTKNAELILNLIRYDKDNPGYVKANWKKLIIRPFFTPTPGAELKDNQHEIKIQHTNFTEIIRKVDITEQVYYPSKEEENIITTPYYAHIGIIQDEHDGFILFANWDYFLDEYFMTAGKANEKLVKGTKTQAVDNPDNLEKKEIYKEKLIESFHNYAPTLYNILTNEKSKVKPIQNFNIGKERLNVMAITVKSEAGIDEAKDELIKTCTDICKEINTTTHLAIWRRYLRTVWLHI
jgi:transcription antitermination factor NusG